MDSNGSAIQAEDCPSGCAYTATQTCTEEDFDCFYITWTGRAQDSDGNWMYAENCPSGCAFEKAELCTPVGFDCARAELEQCEDWEKTEESEYRTEYTKYECQNDSTYYTRYDDNYFLFYWENYEGGLNGINKEVISADYRCGLSCACKSEASYYVHDGGIETYYKICGDGGSYFSHYNPVYDHRVEDWGSAD